MSTARRQIQPKTRSGLPATGGVAEVVERIARETSDMNNSQAWPEIIARLRKVGLSASRAHSLRPAVWLARKVLNTGLVAPASDKEVVPRSRSIRPATGAPTPAPALAETLGAAGEDEMAPAVYMENERL